MEKTTKTVVMAVRLTKKQHDQLKRLATQELTSMGTVIRQGIELKLQARKDTT